MWKKEQDSYLNNRSEGDETMFGLDFAVDGVLDQFCDWIYGKLITFFGEFFGMINMMGAELFELDWIKAILLFFYYFAWALYIVGIVVAVFDTAIDAQRGKGSFQDLALNIIKGFFCRQPVYCSTY